MTPARAVCRGTARYSRVLRQALVRAHPVWPWLYLFETHRLTKGVLNADRGGKAPGLWALVARRCVQVCTFIKSLK